jgi:uncharacterized membrane protein YccC
MRQALQTALAACLAYAAAELLHMPQGFWAVVTAIMIMQANVGASLGQAIDRLAGSLLGVLIGGAAAVLLADTHLLRYAGLAASVLVLAYFAGRRPALRIASVTAAIVILGDPRLGPPISTAGNRIIEVMIGSVIASLTSMFVFPSRAGTSLADHVRRSLPLFFELMGAGLAAGLEGRYEEHAISVMAAKVREAISRINTLAAETRMEIAGHLADHPDPEAMVRTLRRLWHTEIMLLRAVSEPLPAAALAVMRPSLEQLDAVVANLTARHGAQDDRMMPDMQPLQTALSAATGAMAEVRAKGDLRLLSLEEMARLMAFDFALSQLRGNIKDLSERGNDLAAFSGSSLPWLRGIRSRLGATFANGSNA